MCKYVEQYCEINDHLLCGHKVMEWTCLQLFKTEVEPPNEFTA